MKLHLMEKGFRIDAETYSVRGLEGAVPGLVMLREGKAMFRLPVVSGLANIEEEERLTNIKINPEPAPVESAYILRASADSSLWGQRTFQWTFYPTFLEFTQTASGRDGQAVRPGKCYFFSNGVSMPWSNGASQGVEGNATIYTDGYFSPRANHANQFYYSLGVAQSVGILSETPLKVAIEQSKAREQRIFLPEQEAGDLLPTPTGAGIWQQAQLGQPGIGYETG